jgi:hypothetical protein
MAAKLKIKKGDRVVVLTGKDKGKSGDVVAVMPKENRAVVSRRQRGPPPPASIRWPGRWHHFQGNADPRFESGDMSTRRTARPPASVSRRLMMARRSGSHAAPGR